MSDIENTDARLISILESGNELKRCIDPESILDKFCVTGLSCIPSDKAWTLKLEHMQTTVLRIRGSLMNDSTPIISRIEYAVPGGGWKAIAIKHQSTVTQSIGNLSQLPQNLKKAMTAGITKKNKKGLPFDMNYISMTALDALLFGVENKEGFKAEEHFGIYKFHFTDDYEGQPTEVDFASIMNVDGGTITVRAEANIFGLKNKRVILDKHVGLQHYVNVYCTLHEESIIRPSLKTAIMLNKKLPEIFTGDRKKRTGIKEEKPKK